MITSFNKYPFVNRVWAVLGVVVLIVACGSKDRSVQLIQKEFKKYVHLTFDDPKALKEIVLISPSDTLSTEKLKNMIQMALETCDNSLELAHMEDSLQEKTLKPNNIDTRKAQNMEFSTRLKVSSLLSTMVNLISKNMASKTEVILCKDPLIAFADSIKYEAPIYEYSISYRVKRGEGLKLETQYAYIDSLRGFIKILPAQMTKDEYSEQLRKGVSLISDALLKCDKLMDITKQRRENAEELQSIMELYYK